MSLKDVYDYFRSYDRKIYTVVACQGSEPTDADVAAFEREIGFRLPAEFREFTMSSLGGLYMEAREDIWPRAKEFEIGPFWSFLRGLEVFGIAADIPDWLDIRIQAREFREAGVDDLVPFLRIVSDSDPYCFDAAGRIVRWHHEEPERREAEPLTFPDLLMREIRELGKRVAQKRRGEDRSTRG